MEQEVLSANDVVRIDRRLLEIFVAETRRHLDAMRRGVVALRQDDLSKASLIWRGAHTIAGNAAMLDLRAFVEIASAVERLRGERSIDVARAAADWIVDAIDEMESLVNCIEIPASESRTLNLHPVPRPSRPAADA